MPLIKINPIRPNSLEAKKIAAKLKLIREGNETGTKTVKKVTFNEEFNTTLIFSDDVFFQSSEESSFQTPTFSRDFNIPSYSGPDEQNSSFFDNSDSAAFY